MCCEQPAPRVASISVKRQRTVPIFASHIIRSSSFELPGRRPRAQPLSSRPEPGLGGGHARHQRGTWTRHSTTSVRPLMDTPRDVVIVGGCGHIGVPLGLAFADRGLSVELYDLNDEAVAKVNGGESPVGEPETAGVLRRVLDAGLLHATADPDSVSQAEHVVIVIGTPVDEHLNPDLNAVKAAITDIAGHLVEGQILVLRSTVYPGVTAMVERLVEQKGIDVDVAFCPERIAEGNAMVELYQLPQIVAARSQRARRSGDEAVPEPDARSGVPRAGGSRARQAVHERLAVHQVRDREPALHDRERLRDGLRPYSVGRRPELPTSE